MDKDFVTAVLSPEATDYLKQQRLNIRELVKVMVRDGSLRDFHLQLMADCAAAPREARVSLSFTVFGLMVALTEVAQQEAAESN